MPPITASPACFSTGIGSPVSIDSSTVLAPSVSFAVDGDFFAGSHAQRVADCTCSSGTSCSWPFADDAGRRRRERHQLADRAARAAARPQLQHLAQQHQRRNHRGRLKIHFHLAIVLERIGNPAGQQHRHEAVEIRRAILPARSA